MYHHAQLGVDFCLTNTISEEHQKKLLFLLSKHCAIHLVPTGTTLQRGQKHCVFFKGGKAYG
jgi:hypothetical protein